jgi:hypothetical protein
MKEFGGFADGSSRGRFSRRLKKGGGTPRWELRARPVFQPSFANDAFWSDGGTMGWRKKIWRLPLSPEVIGP